MSHGHAPLVILPITLVREIVTALNPLNDAAFHALLGRSRCIFPGRDFCLTPLVLAPSVESHHIPREYVATAASAVEASGVCDKTTRCLKRRHLSNVTSNWCALLAAGA